MVPQLALVLTSTSELLEMFVNGRAKANSFLSLWDSNWFVELCLFCRLGTVVRKHLFALF